MRNIRIIRVPSPEHSEAPYMTFNALYGSKTMSKANNLRDHNEFFVPFMFQKSVPIRVPSPEQSEET